MEMVATLDMQVPTIIMGDFNESVCPTRDYSKGDGFVCSMLARLLGPGGPLFVLQMAVSPNEFAPTFRSLREHQETWSRCGLVLGNRAAFTLIARVHVKSGIMDGGHSPVVVDIHTRPVVLNWKCPQPRVPQWLRVPARDLQQCERWKDRTGAVRDSSAAMQLAALLPDASPHVISSLLANALQEVVKNAGGWESRAADRRPAFESTNVRRARNTAALFRKCSALICGEQACVAGAS